MADGSKWLRHFDSIDHCELFELNLHSLFFVGFDCYALYVCEWLFCDVNNFVFSHDHMHRGGKHTTHDLCLHAMA